MFRRRVYASGSVIHFPRLNEHHNLRGATWQLRLHRLEPGSTLEIRWANGHYIRLLLPNGYFYGTKKALEAILPYS